MDCPGSFCIWFPGRNPQGFGLGVLETLPAFFKRPQIFLDKKENTRQKCRTGFQPVRITGTNRMQQELPFKKRALAGTFKSRPVAAPMEIPLFHYRKKPGSALQLELMLCFSSIPDNRAKEQIPASSGNVSGSPARNLRPPAKMRAVRGKTERRAS